MPGSHDEQRIVLYQFPGGDGLTSLSPPCVKVELALRRMDVPHRVRYCASRGAARKVSATGYLPALDLDGERLCDSTEILDALERRFPAARLAPREATARDRDRLWEHYVNDHVYYLGYYYRWFVPENRERMIRAIFSRAPLPLRWIGPWVFLRSVRARGAMLGLDAWPRERADRGFRRALDVLERGLDGGPFLQGRDEPGRGDLASAALIAQAGFAKTLPDVEAGVRAHPALLEHTRRVFESCSIPPPKWLA